MRWQALLSLRLCPWKVRISFVVLCIIIIIIIINIIIVITIIIIVVIIIVVVIIIICSKSSSSINLIDLLLSHTDAPSAPAFQLSIRDLLKSR
jgi:hypothetical protein